MAEQSRGTHFPDLPQPPDAAAALQRLAQSIENAQKQATSAIEAIDSLQEAITRGKQVLDEFLKRRVQA